MGAHPRSMDSRIQGMEKGGLMQPLIDIIVPVHDNLYLTARFVKAAWSMAVAYRENTRILIVDNGSTDDTAGWMSSQMSGVMHGRLVHIHSPNNLGFSGGNNLGFAASFADILIFTSNDVLVEGDFVSPVARYLEMRPGELVGAEFLEHDTGWNVFEKDGQRLLIPYLAGWFIASTRETWEEIGGWDDRFFPCDYEDIDLSYRATQVDIPLTRLSLPLRHEFGQTARGMDRAAITAKSQAAFMEKWGLSHV